MQLSCRRERRLDLRRVVRVVVVDRHAARRPVELEPPPHAAEAGQSAGGLFPVDAGQLERRQRRRSVSPIVIARHRKLETHRLQVVAPHRKFATRHPAVEELRHLGTGSKRRMVVEIDVRQHADFRMQQLERPVRLVTFRHQPSASRSRIATELGDRPTDEVRRVEAELADADRRSSRPSSSFRGRPRPRSTALTPPAPPATRPVLRPSTRPANAVETTGSQPSGGAGAPARSRRPLPPAARDTASPRGPSRRPPHPRRVQRRRARSSPRRRCRRTRAFAR